MIAVIDYKAGNLTSVVKALRYLRSASKQPDDILITQNPEDVHRADKIVLPGVGHFQSTQLLTDLGLTHATREAAAAGKPFLGICVGLQWLYEGSTEAPSTPGLAHFSGKCERFPPRFDDTDLKSPHVGWNSLDDIRPGSRLLANVAPGSFVYYTHSWRAPISPDTAATTFYGGAFTAAVERDNVMGVQFHPEKSAAIGLQILKNFLRL
jgi:glutamine amidotransferase